MLRTRLNGYDKYHLTSTFFALAFVLLHAFRMWGALYQMKKSIIRDGCLSYDPETNFLSKTPFAPGCFRAAGLYLIFFVNFLD